MSYKYKAFISYSRKDKKIVEWFHKNLELYKTPKSLASKYNLIPKKVGKIFKDVDELSSHHSLDSVLKEVLEQSEYLIVFCSTNSANSHFVNEEIKYFKDKYREEKIIPIIIDGEPNATVNSNFSNDLESFPQALRIDENGIPLNPLAIDIRPLKDSRKKALIKVVSTMFGIWFDDIWEREKKRIILNNTLLTLFSISILTIITYTIFSIQNAKEVSIINNNLITRADTLKRSSKELNYIEKEIKGLSLKLIYSKTDIEKEAIKIAIDKLESKKISILELLEEFNILSNKKYIIEARNIYENRGVKKAIEFLESDKLLQNDKTIINELIEKNNLKAKLYNVEFNYEKVLELYEKNWNLAKTEFKYTHDISYSIFNDLIKVYTTLEKFEQAINISNKILKDYNNSLGVNNNKTLTVHNTLAKLYFRSRNYTKAKEHFHLIYENTKNIFGINSIESIISLKNLSKNYKYLGNYKKLKDINESIKNIKNELLVNVNNSEKYNLYEKLKKSIDLISTLSNIDLDSKEIIISIMENKTGEILYLSSKNAIEYQFEPGSVIKPISISLVMDKNRIKKNELFFAHNTKGKANKKGEFPKGKYKLGRFTIKDGHRFKKHYLTLDDIVINSSNIGTLKLAQRLSGPEFYEGLKRFGFTRKTGINLPYEKKGIMPKVWQFSASDKDKKDNLYKATVSYGQGIASTFMQVLKAYSVFSNDGLISTPRIVSHLVHNGNKYKAYEQEPERVITKKTANEIKRLLIKTVSHGTEKAAQIEGLEIGGKTATAQIARRGKYLEKYISSFFGFVNDGNNSYTIGVTVINPVSTGNYWYYKYATWSAVPVFKEIVEILVNLDLLEKYKN